MSYRQYIAAREELLDMTKALDVIVHHQLEQGRREPKEGDTGLLNRVSQLFQRRRVRRQQRELGTVKEAGPHLERGGIKRERSQLKKNVLVRHLRVIWF